MSKFRNIKINSQQYNLYKDIYKNQTLDYVLEMKNKYSNLNNKKMTIHKALSLLDKFIDPSDPDLDIENSIHAYQTAERIRKKYPDNKQLQITGLIHDLGKILFSFNEPNWSIVGDTFVVGCKHSDKIILNDLLINNPDYNKYDKNGIYKKKCGLNNLHLSYGHDEYLYQVLIENKKKHLLSDKYLNIIRYHSFYPWHTEKDYHYFMNDNDKKILNDVLLFNEFDLYSKEDDIKITNDTKNYYFTILNEYFHDELQW
jgi:inositol oxygenase